MITFLLPLFFSFRQLELEIVGVFVSNCAISTIYSPKLSKPKMIITTTTNVGTKQTKHTNNCIFFWINIACLFVHSNIAVSAPIYDNLRPKKKTMKKKLGVMNNDYIFLENRRRENFTSLVRLVFFSFFGHSYHIECIWQFLRFLSRCQ